MHLEKNTIGRCLEQARDHSPTEDIDRVEKKTKSHSRIVGVRCLMEETTVAIGRSTRSDVIKDQEKQNEKHHHEVEGHQELNSDQITCWRTKSDSIEGIPR